MAKSGKTGRDRIEREGSQEGFSEAMAQTIAHQAWPGIFSGGKQIIATKSEPGSILFAFSDGTAMRVVGEFTVQYANNYPGVPVESEDDEDFIEGTAWEVVEPDALENK